MTVRIHRPRRAFGLSLSGAMMGIRVTATALLLAMGAAPSAAQSAPPGSSGGMFMPAERPQPGERQAQRTLNPLRERFVAPDFDLIRRTLAEADADRTRRVRFEIFPDVTLELNTTRFEVRGNGFSWTGETGGHGQAHLFYSHPSPEEEAIYGTFYDWRGSPPNRSYSLSWVSANAHVFEEPDQSCMNGADEGPSPPLPPHCTATTTTTSVVASTSTSTTSSSTTSTSTTTAPVPTTTATPPANDMREAVALVPVGNGDDRELPPLLLVGAAAFELGCVLAVARTVRRRQGMTTG